MSRWSCAVLVATIASAAGVMGPGPVLGDDVPPPQRGRAADRGMDGDRGRTDDHAQRAERAHRLEQARRMDLARHMADARHADPGGQAEPGQPDPGEADRTADDQERILARTLDGEAHHRHQLARLRRLHELAIESGDAARAQQVAALREHLQERHQRWRRAHRDQLRDEWRDRLDAHLDLKRERVENRAERRDDRRDDRADRRDDRREDRAERRDERHEDRAERRDERGDERAERRDDRRDDRTDRRDDRAERREDRAGAPAGAPDPAAGGSGPRDPRLAERRAGFPGRPVPPRMHHAPPRDDQAAGGAPSGGPSGHAAFAPHGDGRTMTLRPAAGARADQARRSRRLISQEDADAAATARINARNAAAEFDALRKEIEGEE